jgi:hypothetical protein
MNVMTAQRLRWERTFMRAFTIDAENDITVLPSPKGKERSRQEYETFATQAELGALAEKWPSARLVEIWNSLPGVEPVKRFTSRAIAIGRVWKAIQHLQPVTKPSARSTRSKTVLAKPALTDAGRTSLSESKATLVISLLRDSKGATLQRVIDATGWQPHTVRGFISGHLKKKLGLRIRSFKRDGERVYAIKG